MGDANYSHDTLNAIDQELQSVFQCVNIMYDNDTIQFRVRYDSNEKRKKVSYTVISQDGKKELDTMLHKKSWTKKASNVTSITILGHMGLMKRVGEYWEHVQPRRN